MNSPETFTSYPLNKIQPGFYFSEPVYLDDDFILTSPEMTLDSENIAILQKWEFRELFSKGEPVYDNAEVNTTKVEVSESAFYMDKEKVRMAEKFIGDFRNEVETLFMNIDVSHRMAFPMMAQRMKDICDFVKENRRFILRVLRDIHTTNYIVSHSVRTAIIAIVIGYYIKLPQHRIIELGISGLLHDIGMVKLPKNLYLSEKALGPQERKVIMTHPVLGFTILKGMNYPLSITLAALEHHERENGTGYPRKITGDKISLYSKIVAVACSYDALCSQRPHKEAKDGYTGMLELLKNEGKQYDETVIRALVFSLSIYPIGLHVLLSNGKQGQVVDVNPENPRFPIVRIFDYTQDGQNVIVGTTPHGVSIVRLLGKDEISSPIN